MATLSLTRYDRPARGPDDRTLRFERRRHPRWSAEGWVSVTCADKAERCSIGSIDLTDASVCGLGGVSKIPLRTGAVVTLWSRTSRVPWREAEVVRCDPLPGETGAFRVGLRFDTPSAA